MSKLFLRNLGFAVMIIFGAIMILLLWMNIYTRHGQARPVPNFIGLTMDQTIKLAKKSKLRFQVLDSIYSTEVQRGCIAEQSPNPGFKVKKWRNIVLTINAFHPEMVAVPNLINLPKRQAILNAESSGLEIGQLKYRPDISTDMVIDQEYNGRKIQEGDSIQKGSVVDLVLGKGLSDQRTPVPDLIGLKLNSSKNKILSASLNLGTFVYDKTIVNSADTINAFVYKQLPEYKDDASLKLGSSIYLWLTVDSTKLQATPDLSNPDSIMPAAVSDNQSN